MDAPEHTVAAYLNQLKRIENQDEDALINAIDNIFHAGYEYAVVEAVSKKIKKENEILVRGMPWELLACPRCDSAKVSMIQNEVNGVTEKSYDCQNCGCTWDVL